MTPNSNPRQSNGRTSLFRRTPQANHVGCVIAASVVFTLLGSATPPQVAEGRLLIHQKNCGACHEEFPQGAAGPDLAGLKHRIGHEALQAFISSPHTIKNGTRMPSLFHRNAKPPAGKREPGNRIEKEIQALTHYLLSLDAPKPLAASPAGNLERGRDLYQSIGCLACHQNFGPETLDHSVPLVLGQTYTHDALVDYLLVPESELMPAFKLTQQEAADLAAWIHHFNQPSRIEEAPFTPSEQLVEAGRSLFKSRRCVSCHGSPEKNLPAALPQVPITEWQRGCLSPAAQSGVPNYELTPPQREAILAASKSSTPETPAEVIDHTLTTYRCFSCHQRDGKGGPSEQRRPFFKVAEQMAESYGDFGNIPPKLDHVGRKLTREWLRKILVDGRGEVRPYLATRMPHYNLPEVVVEKLLVALETADQRIPPIEIDVSGLPRHQRGHYGRDLMGTKGLNCITCHGLKGQRALGAPVIDLTHTALRLRPAWFKEVLLDPQSVQPGTLMPPLFLNRPKADQEVEQIWTYLKEIDQRRLPDGLLRTGNFELKPQEEGKPMVFRTFLEGVGTHAIAVGFPQGTHLAFDSRSSQWALVWKGRFLDAMSTWDDRYATPATPLGKDLYHFTRDDHQRRFQGFRLDPKGTPIFLYTEHGVPVEDSIAPDSRGNLHRTVRRGATTTRQSVHFDKHQASFRNEE